ncbi:MAG: ribosome recycling factor [Candidatus Blackburnbacteria bacterium]|nr:ribosome recycling factor [Candidatus Blackburnbacteria bacterium]
MDEAQTRERMDHGLEEVRREMGGIRTGRATPALVEDIVVPAYGGPPAGGAKLRLIELATITAPDPQSLLISPWDKSIVGEIRKGILEANVGLNPVITGDELRINLPPLTAEDRENYIRLLHQKLESGRVKIRQVRQDRMREIKESFENKELSEDERDREEKKIQALTDEYTGKIDEMGKTKESELRSL